ncbi:MAG: FMN-binding protein [Acidobacteria bacterium]|nr:FMN-binding protein [Acidobacteriota bacterium]
MSIRSRSVSGICSSASAARGPGFLTARRARALLLVPAIAATLWSPAAAKVFMTQDEAIAAAFGPGKAPERRTSFLSDEQAERVRALAGTAPPTKIIVSCTAGTGPDAVTAYFDSHLVRTLPETIMVVVGASGKATRVEILSFEEPEDYLPKRRWLDQFDGRPLDDQLTLTSGLRAVTGATLSSRAITDAVRRILAVHSVLAPAPAPAPAPKGGAR